QVVNAVVVRAVVLLEQVEASSLVDRRIRGDRARRLLVIVLSEDARPPAAAVIAVEHDRDHREGDVFRHRPAPYPELSDILLQDLPAAVRDLESPLRRIDALPEPPTVGRRKGDLFVAEQVTENDQVSGTKERHPAEVAAGHVL